MSSLGKSQCNCLHRSTIEKCCLATKVRDFPYLHNIFLNFSRCIVYCWRSWSICTLFDRRQPDTYSSALDLHFELEQPYSSNKFSTRRTGSIRRSAVPMPKVPVPAKVNHHVYRSVPPRMERLSLSKTPVRYLVGGLRLPGFSTGLPGNLH